MACERYLDDLSARLDGELTAGEAAELEAHLALCPSCRALAERLDALRAGFEALEEVPAPAGLAQGVMDRVREKRAPVPLFRRPQVRALAGLAACLVLCAGIWHSGLLARSAPAEQEAPAPGTADASVSPREAPLLEGADTSSASESTDSPSMFSMAPAAPEDISPDPAPDGVTDQTFDGADVSLPAAIDLPPQEKIALQGEQGSLAFENEQVLRVCWGHTPAAPSAQIIGGADSLADFLGQFPMDDLSAVADTYDDSFFETHRLLAVVAEAGSGSVRFSLAGVTDSQAEICREVPEIGTCDMAAWLILAEVPPVFQDGQTLAVIFEP